MEKSYSFMTDDDQIFDVPESKLKTFQKDAEAQKVALREVKKYADPEGGIFDVPADKHDAFMQDAQAQGVQLEEVNSVHTLGQTFDVPKSKAVTFHDDWSKDPEADKEREESAKQIASKLDAPDSPIWEGVKTFFSPKNYAENASLEGVSATSANALKALASAPATIADKLAGAEQFGSRLRELPGAKAAMMFSPYSAMALSGMGVESILSLKGKDGGKEYRDLIQKGREYVDGKREEFLGYTDEKGQKTDDFALTLGAQAINSVAESYLLTAPKVMQGINGMIRAGGKGILAKMTPSLQTMLYGASQAESTAGKAEDKGMSNERAVGYGLLTGTIESALESVSQVTGLQDVMAKNALKEAVARTVWKKAGQVLKDAGGEGLTEFGQQAGSSTVEKLAKIDEKTWGQIGMESASAAVLGFISGGASASANGIFDNQGRKENELRAQQEGRAIELGQQAEQESVLEADATAAPQGETDFQAQGAQPDVVGGDPRQGAAVPVESGVEFEGQIVPALEVSPGVRALPQEAGRGVRLELKSGKQLVSYDPGLAALVEYWYKDRVLFPPAPEGDIGRQAGDVTMNASRRAGFQVKPSKRVLITIGRSKQSYRGTIVQILDGNTVRVKIDKTQRSLKNSRAGYADVDVRQLAQFSNVIAAQERESLMNGMTKEQKDRVNADAKAFKDEIVDIGLFLDQDTWLAVDGVKGSRSRKVKDDLILDAYARVSDMLGIPLDNHLQRAAALPLLRQLHEQAQGVEGFTYEAYAEQLARESELDMQERRASGEFSLEDMTADEMDAADARLAAQMHAQEARKKMLARAAAPLEGDAGDLTGELFGAFDEMPLFGGAQDQQGGDELFNMDIPSQSQGRAYNQEESGGADTPRAQTVQTPIEDGRFSGRNTVGMDMMDAVQMFYVLRGKLPKIRERMREGVMGSFSTGTQDIELLAGIFGLYDQEDSDRIRKGLEKKGFRGPKLDEQIDIEVRALVEKRRKENMKKPLKVMVHELSHYVDFLPDGLTRDRGNILGHIAGLKKHFERVIGPEVGAPGALTDADKARIRRSAEAEMKKKMGEARTEIETITREVPEYQVLGIQPDDVKGLLGMDGRTETPELYDWFSRQDTATKRSVLMAAMKGVIDERMAALGSRVQTGTKTVTEQVTRDIHGYTKEAGRKRFRELLAEETAKRRLIELDQIKAEAEKIIPWWRGTPGMESYFTKPTEMYAELFGIFLADPSELRARAPTVYRAFAGWMDARPEVAAAYEAFLDAKSLPVEERMKEKFRLFRKGRNKADEDARREVLLAMTEPSKALKEAEFKYFFHRRTAPTKMTLDAGRETLLEAAKTPQEKARIQKMYEQARLQIKKLSALGWRTRYYESLVDARVAVPLQKQGLDMFDLDEYQSLMRIAYELDGKAAPAGVEPATALQMLEARRIEYGEAKFAALEAAATEFRNIREREVLADEDLRRMFSDELLATFDNNKQYVTFSHVRTIDELNKIKKALKDSKSGDKKIATDAVDVLAQEIERRAGNTVGAKIYKYVGSFGNIKNTIVATLEKDDNMRRQAARNRLKIMVAEMAGEAGIFEYVMPAKMERNSKGIMVPVMVDNDNWRTVAYMDKGIIKGFVAMKPLADSLEKGSMREIASMNLALKANNLFTGLLTRFRFGFAILNNMKDVPAAANQVPGLDRMGIRGVSVNFFPLGPQLSTLQRYRMFEVPTKAIISKLGAYGPKHLEWHLAPGRRAAIIIQKGTFAQTEDKIKQLIKDKKTSAAKSLQEDLDLATEGIKNPIIMSYLEAISESGTMDDYSRRMFRSGMNKEDIIQGLNVAARLRGLFRNVGFTLERWGETGELTTKLAVWRALKDNKDISEEQKILITRELGGSPDFSESGAARSYVEFATRPFVNAAKEGSIAAYNSFERDPAGASIKMMKHTVLPTVARWALGSGFLLELFKFLVPDEEDRKKYWGYGFLKWYYKATSNMPNYQKKLFHTNPIPISPDSGEVTKEFTGAWSVLLSAPMDHVSQILASATWNSLDAAGESMLDQFKRSRDPNAAPTVLSTSLTPGQEVKDLAIEAFLPLAMGEAPVLKIAGLTWGYVFGGNYHDSFRDTDVWTEDELLARFKTHDAVEKLGVELWNSLGGTSIKRLNAGNDLNYERPPKLREFLNLPFVQPLLGSTIKVATGGQAQMERKLNRIEKVFEAPVKLEAKNDFARAVKEGNGEFVNMSDDIMAKRLPQEGGSYADLVKSQIYNEEFERLTSEYYRTKNIRETVGQPFYNWAKEENLIMRDIRIDIMNR